MEYELHPDGSLTPLPKQNIDTGLGLERAARIVQDVASVYDTDGYQLIMEWIAARSGVAYGDSADATKAHRVLADHGRGMTFLVSDGVTPSNEGRGYVLRRVIRRAVQHGLRIGMETPFVAGLSDTVIDQMAGAYPELAEHRDRSTACSPEEERFGETLDRGMKLFEELAGDGGRSPARTRSRSRPRTASARADDRARAASAACRGRGRHRELMAEHREISRAGGESDERAAEFARDATSAPSSSATRSSTCSPRSGALGTSATAASSPSSASRRSTPPAAAR